MTDEVKTAEAEVTDKEKKAIEKKNIKKKQREEFMQNLQRKASFHKIAAEELDIENKEITAFHAAEFAKLEEEFMVEQQKDIVTDSIEAVRTAKNAQPLVEDNVTVEEPRLAVNEALVGIVGDADKVDEYEAFRIKAYIKYFEEVLTFFK
jgi:hypothetical protein